MGVLIPGAPPAVVGRGDYFEQLDEYAKKYGMKGYLSAYSRSQDSMVYLPVMRLDFRLVPHRPGPECEVKDIPGLIKYWDLVVQFLPHQLLVDGLQSNTPVGPWSTEREPGLEIFDSLSEIE